MIMISFITLKLILEPVPKMYSFALKPNTRVSQNDFKSCTILTRLGLRHFYVSDFTLFTNASKNAF